MVIVANEPPYLICIETQLPVAGYQFPSEARWIPINGKGQTSFRLPFPSPRREAREELNTKNHPSSFGPQPSAKSKACPSERSEKTWFPSPARYKVPA